MKTPKTQTPEPTHSAIKKGEVVELENSKQGIRPFSVTEANTLLNMPQNNGLWALPANSKYQFQDGKIIRSASTSTDSLPKE